MQFTPNTRAEACRPSSSCGLGPTHCSARHTLARGCLGAWWRRPAAASSRHLTGVTEAARARRRMMTNGAGGSWRRPRRRRRPRPRTRARCRQRWRRRCARGTRVCAAAGCRSWRAGSRACWRPRAPGRPRSTPLRCPVRAHINQRWYFVMTTLSGAGSCSCPLCCGRNSMYDFVPMLCVGVWETAAPGSCSDLAWRQPCAPRTSCRRRRGRAGGRGGRARAGAARPGRARRARAQEEGAHRLPARAGGRRRVAPPRRRARRRAQRAGLVRAGARGAWPAAPVLASGVAVASKALRPMPRAACTAVSACLCWPTLAPGVPPFCAVAALWCACSPHAWSSHMSGCTRGASRCAFCSHY